MTTASETNRVRVKLEFVVHLDRGVDTIPFTSRMLHGILEAAETAAVKGLGGKGLAPVEMQPPTDAFIRQSDEAASKLTVVPMACTDEGIKVDLVSSKMRRRR